jgi:hypothetical protein
MGCRVQGAYRQVCLLECIQEGSVQGAYSKVSIMECIQEGEVQGAYRKVGLGVYTRRKGEGCIQERGLCRVQTRTWAL